ncbi:ABC transporter ATP-binding protein [Halobacterium zhouii]|uniref:ABC transporter ATP-binding protein n=1 Tax=Halobacterium zhouii TaxID=2902624 RepID=UPI001E376ADE|nr:ABC transporter ATP-binding protein [Halobacterium zhouii]
MTGLELDGVTRRFGATTAVDDVTLSVDDGEFFTLVGPSGCGKTTTLRLIAGFEGVDEGEVRFGDESVAGVPPEERDVGIVFQSYALFPHMTVAENVGYGLRFTDPPAGQSREERVEELLDLVDLSGFGDRSPEELSGGQQQRVALARALAPEPSVLLLDEPMSALDARLRERLRVQVKEIQSELDITTVYVTHDQEEALSISDRVAVMNDGRVEQVGTPEAVYRDPASTFVASFVGDNNVFYGASPVEMEGSAVRVGDSTFEVEGGVDGVDTLCIRPESLHFDSGVNTIPVRVESVEFLGDAYRVHCDWNGRDVLVKTREKPPTGEGVVGFDPEDATLL